MGGPLKRGFAPGLDPAVYISLIPLGILFPQCLLFCPKPRVSGQKPRGGSALTLTTDFDDKIFAKVSLFLYFSFIFFVNKIVLFDVCRIADKIGLMCFSVPCCSGQVSLFTARQHSLLCRALY